MRVCRCLDRFAAGRLLASLARRVRVNSRDGVNYVTVRSWRRDHAREQIQALKHLKDTGSPELVAAAAQDIVACLSALFGRHDGCTITNVPSGHSRRRDSFARLIAKAVAEQTGMRYRSIWADRPLNGSSHPKASFARPQLHWQSWPTGRVIVIDDVATSGSHIEEALFALRAAGFPAFGVAWIGGGVEVRESEEARVLLCDFRQAVELGRAAVCASSRVGLPMQLELFGIHKG